MGGKREKNLYWGEGGGKRYIKPQKSRGVKGSDKAKG